MLRKGITEEEAKKRIQRVNLAFPDACVLNYETLIDSLTLPDEDDRHVLAAAITADADVIVTNNTKDFPEEVLILYGLKRKNADDFLTDIIDLNQEIALEAFEEMVLNKKNPEMYEYKVLESFRKNQLIQTANYLHSLI